MCGLSVLMSMWSWFHRLGAGTGTSRDVVEGQLSVRVRELLIGQCRAEWTGWKDRRTHTDGLTDVNGRKHSGNAESRSVHEQECARLRTDTTVRGGRASERVQPVTVFVLSCNI
ncbi:unnamed protein product, partial [Pleuronectes platessa]